MFGTPRIVVSNLAAVLVVVLIDAHHPCHVLLVAVSLAASPGPSSSSVGWGEGTPAGG